MIMHAYIRMYDRIQTTSQPWIYLMLIPLVVTKKYEGQLITSTRYSNQQGFKSRQNPCQVQLTENVGNLSTSRRYFWVRITVFTVWSAASILESELQATEKTFWCAAHPTKSSKVIKTCSSSRRVTLRQIMRRFTSDGIDQC